MKKYTISEYAKKIKKTREAVFYQIKKQKIKAKKNSSNEWVIFVDDEEKKNQDTILNSDLVDLKIKIALLEEQKKADNEILKERIKGLETDLKAKDEIIKAKNETIEAEKRSNQALLYNLQTTKEQQTILLEKPKKSFFESLKIWKKVKKVI